MTETPTYAHDAHCNTIHEAGPEPCPPHIEHKGFEKPAVDRAPVITGNAFIDALLASGIITVEERVRRIVIEATADNLVVMHVERLGDKRLLEVVPALAGVEIRREEPAEGSEAAV